MTTSSHGCVRMVRMRVEFLPKNIGIMSYLLPKIWVNVVYGCMGVFMESGSEGWIDVIVIVLSVSQSRKTLMLLKNRTKTMAELKTFYPGNAERSSSKF